jgi:alpha-glucuronidase
VKLSRYIYILILNLSLNLFLSVSHADDGYRLWLRYDKIENPALLSQYKNQIRSFHFYDASPTITIARKELSDALKGLLGQPVPENGSASNGSLLIFKNESHGIDASTKIDFKSLGKEGFAIYSVKAADKNFTVISANTDIGILYGVFHFLRLMQMHQSIQNLSITSAPKIQNRLLNHWDNLTRHVERGYAGISIFNWHTLPGYIDQRYIDYARANASIGINGTVVTNVNANALILTKEYLEKFKALADVFRPYGIRLYLTARFSAPIELGKLKTADPLDSSVRNWWKEKINEIYQYIPDFGGFLVKANSEGQPGPQNYGRTHADGANMLAEAVAPHGGIVMWRAFVYSNETPEDRVKQAYIEFKPLDGKFRNNVLIQVKNGPLDFQPREPFSPLFGAMPQTPLMMEFQITQEYLGQGTNLVYEAPLFKEVLDADTYQNGPGSTVKKVIDGSLDNYSITGMAGVSNIGNDRNWTGHLFGQANWYAFGRLAWDHDLSAATIADEWIKESFPNNPKVIATIKQIMLSSRETLVNYMTPLGLHHIMGTGHHYGPAPWVSNAGRADWNPVYYHKADSFGIGFERSARGSNALEQYAPEVRKIYEDSNSCPEKYLLWFHHVSWNHKMKSGRNLWEELCHSYNAGVDSVKAMQEEWNSLKPFIDEERFRHVQMLLEVQLSEAKWWRNACLLYFQTFSGKPIPAQYEKPDHTLAYYEGLRFPYAPGTGN